MTDLTDLYQQVIIDHGRHPRQFGMMENPSCQQEGFNPLCGDRLTVYLRLEQDQIVDVRFRGVGCAISMASASLMSQSLLGKRKEEALLLFQAFHDVVTTGHSKQPIALGKLAVLSGVSAYPARVKCATLCWHTLLSALKGETNQVSTEEKP